MPDDLKPVRVARRTSAYFKLHKLKSMPRHKEDRRKKLMHCCTVDTLGWYNANQSLETEIASDVSISRSNILHKISDTLFSFFDFTSVSYRIRKFIISQQSKIEQRKREIMAYLQKFVNRTT